MTDRIKINKSEDKFEITIKSFINNKKQKLLLVWIVLFSFCGLAIISQFFGNYNAETKVFFGVYIAFWIYFEFKVIYAYRWRKYGEEKKHSSCYRVILPLAVSFLLNGSGRRWTTLDPIGRL